MQLAFIWSDWTIFTARVHSMTEGTVFTGVCLSTPGRGVSQWLVPGPFQGDTPARSRWGSPARSRWDGYPPHPEMGEGGTQEDLVLKQFRLRFIFYLMWMGLVCFYKSTYLSFRLFTCPGVFTPPVSGLYQLSVYARSFDSSGPIYIRSNDRKSCVLSTSALDLRLWNLWAVRR